MLLARTGLALLLLAPTMAHATTLYVDPSAPGLATGLTWEDAFTDLSSALAATEPDDVLWVASGTYVPTTGTDRTISLELPARVTLLGGFAGTELAASERDPALHVTTLSGEIGDPLLRTDNSLHVVICHEASVLDGFTITGGYGDADPLELSYQGAGILVVGSDVTIRNSRIVGNSVAPPGIATGSGGGLSALSAVADVLIEDCWFEDNHALGGNASGGALALAQAEGDILRTTFVGNTAGNAAGAVRYARLVEDCHFEDNASDGQAGALFAATNVVGSMFVGNTAQGSGGGASYCSDLERCDFIGNSAGAGGALWAIPTAKNCRFLDNSSTGNGGAVGLAGSPGGSFEGCVFAGNEADGSGGAVAGYSPLFVNSSIVGNYAAGQGGGLFIVGVQGSIRVANTIVWGNTAGIDDNVRTNTSPAIGYAHSIVQGSGGSGAGWQAVFGIDGGGNHDVDPRFVDAPAGDLRTGGMSPGYDAGDASYATLTEDLARAPRVIGSAIDIGAFETPPLAGPIAYLDAAATGAADGSNWSDAFTKIREALILPAPGLEEIWIAAGTYTASADRILSIPLRNGVTLYGGFAGNENAVNERDWAANPTLFSGEVGLPGLLDNTNHVVDASGCDSTAVLDGVTIGDGHALPPAYNVQGAGIWIDGGNPVFRNVVLRDHRAWHGAAVAMQNGARPTFINTVAFDNEAENDGSVLHAIDSSPAVINATFAANVSPGAALRGTGGGTLTLVNSVVSHNGLALSYDTSPPLVHHSLLEGSGASGAGWNPAYGTDGGGNLDTDPLFVDLPARDLHLAAGSPAIDAGDDGALTWTTDVEGNPRFIGVIDMGAYESGTITAVPNASTPATLRAFPNPFNPRVTLRFTLPVDAHAEVVVTDVRGRTVRMLHRDWVAATMSLEWDGTDDTGQPVASGVYFARLHAGDVQEAVKLVVMK